MGGIRSGIDHFLKKHFKKKKYIYVFFDEKAEYIFSVKCFVDICKQYQTKKKSSDC